MKLLSLILSFLFLLQNVQVSQGAQLILSGDAEEMLNSITCYIIPCVDESLGWRNFFAPIAVGEGGTQEVSILVTPEGSAVGAGNQQDESAVELRQQLRTMAVSLFTAFLESRQQGTDAGNNGNLRGRVLVDSTPQELAL